MTDCKDPADDFAAWRNCSRSDCCERSNDAAVNIAGVPDSIDRIKVVDMLASLGIDLNNVVGGDNAGGVLIGWRSIECTVYALQNGKRYFDTGLNRVATHRISIPIVDPEPDAA